MKNRIVQLRDFLNRNKVFFEVLAAIVLTITSIFVSVKANSIANQGNNIADQANNIAKIQTSIMESENTPSIEIQKEQRHQDSNNVTKWYVYNNNSKISNFEIEEQKSFINIIKRKSNEEINFPIVEYINSAGNLTGKSDGLVYEFDNKDCGQDEFLTREKIWDYGYMQIKSFVAVSYNTVLKKRETKYYQVAPQIQPISRKDWDSINEDWRSKNSDVMYLKYVERNIERIKKNSLRN